MKNSFMRSIKNIIPFKFRVAINRLKVANNYDKEEFILKGSSDVFSDVYDTDLWNSAGSGSGGGSEISATATIREQLPLIIKKYSIQSMLDAPCGDYTWMKEVEKNWEYTGGDIVAELIERNQKLYASDKVKFIHVDIAKDPLPQVDLIFCKDCLQHLSYEKVAGALNNFKKSGSKYLLVTSYPLTWKNHDIYDGDYRALNLLKYPFSLPSPLMKVKEKSTGIDVEIDKTMYLYKLESIPEIKLK